MAPYTCAMGVGVGPKIFKTIQAQKKVDQDIFKTKPIIFYKGHMAPYTCAVGVDVGPGFFETIQAQKVFTQDISKTKPI